MFMKLPPSKTKQCKLAVTNSFHGEFLIHLDLDGNSEFFFYQTSMMFKVKGSDMDDKRVLINFPVPCRIARGYTPVFA